MVETTVLTNSLLLGMMPGVEADRSLHVADMDDTHMMPGLHRTSMQTLNMPDGVYQFGLLEVSVCSWSGSIYIRQIYVPDQGDIIYRLAWAGSWRSWRKIPTEKL